MKDETERENKLILIASKSFPYYEEMYKVVDFLNKNIKDKKIMLGLTRDKETGDVNIKIYEF